MFYTLCLLYSAINKEKNITKERKREFIAYFGEYFNENTICMVRVKRVVS